MGYKLQAGDFDGSRWDAVTIAYPEDDTEVYSFRDGGTSGTVLFTVTLVYTDATKTVLTSMARS